jgi:hypothetical protein
MELQFELGEPVMPQFDIPELLIAALLLAALVWAGYNGIHRAAR